MQKKKIHIGLSSFGKDLSYGPLMACAFAVDYTNLPDGFDALSQKSFEEIVGLENVCIGMGEVRVEELEDTDIEGAEFLAFQRALNLLSEQIDLEYVHTVIANTKISKTFDQLKKDPLFIAQAEGKKPEVAVAQSIAQQMFEKRKGEFELLTHKKVGVPQKQKDVTSFHRANHPKVQIAQEQKPKMLLHICCGPDACVPFLDYKDQYEIIAFWYDPNIHPKAEYDKRLDAFKKVCEIEGIKWIEGEYDTDNFFEEIKGLEETPEQGAKCMRCYDMRLLRSVKKAKEQDCDIWTTTLLTSPHKTAEKLCQMGKHLEESQGVEFLDVHFRKNGGFDRSVKYTKKHDIYRQNYCGCIYSDTFPEEYKK